MKPERAKSLRRFAYTSVLLLFAAATALAVFFGFKYFEAAGKTDSEYPDSTSDSVQIIIPEGTTPELLFFAITANGYSADDMLSAIKSGDEEAFRAFAEEYLSENSAAIPDNTQTPDETDIGTAPSYTALYPDLYAENPPSEFTRKQGTIYLTFDDGPSARTPEILDILSKYDIKATFFFCGGDDEKSRKLMKRVADEEHTVAVHSISHDYNKIYSSVESYLDDFYATYSSVYTATGVKPQIFRFPGGSINSYNRFIYQQIIAEMTRRGFVYYDWNVSGDDAVKGTKPEGIKNNILNNIPTDGSGTAIVLLHDAQDKTDTVAVLPEIIEQLLAEGYTFDKLDNTVKPTTFTYK